MARELRERAPGELIGEAFKVLFHQFFRVLGIHLAIWIPGALALGLLVSTMLRTGDVMMIYVVQAAVWIVLQPLAAAASMLAISDEYTGRRTLIRTCLFTALSRLLSIVFINIARWVILLVVYFVIAMVIGFFAALGGVAAAVGAVVGVIGGFLLLMRIFATYYCSEQVCLLEKVGGITAMGRSSDLTSGYRWGIGWLVVCLVWCSAMIFWGSMFVGGMIAQAGPGFGIPAGLLMLLGMLFGAMLVASGAVTVYFNQRVRKEAFDVDELVLLVDEIGSRGPARE